MRTDDVPVDQPDRTVLIVEDHQLLAESLGVALGAEGLDVRLAGVRAGADVLAEAERHRPAVVLLDLDLGGRHEGGEAYVAGLGALGGRVVVVSGSTDALRLGTCLELGAAAVLSKSRPFEDVLRAVLDAVAGRQVMRDADRQELLAAARRRRAEDKDRLAPYARLTTREAEVLRLLMDGCQAEAIAAGFVVSEATVRTQIRAVLSKLGVRSQLSAVAEAHRAGWEGPTPPGR